MCYHVCVPVNLANTRCGGMTMDALIPLTWGRPPKSLAFLHDTRIRCATGIRSIRCVSVSIIFWGFPMMVGGVEDQRTRSNKFWLLADCWRLNIFSRRMCGLLGEGSKLIKCNIKKTTPKQLKDSQNTFVSPFVVTIADSVATQDLSSAAVGLSGLDNEANNVFQNHDVM